MQCNVNKISPIYRAYLVKNTGLDIKAIPAGREVKKKVKHGRESGSINGGGSKLKFALKI